MDSPSPQNFRIDDTRRDRTAACTRAPQRLSLPEVAATFQQFGAQRVRNQSTGNRSYKVMLYPALLSNQYDGYRLSVRDAQVQHCQFGW